MNHSLVLYLFYYEKDRMQKGKETKNKKKTKKKRRAFGA